MALDRSEVKMRKGAECSAVIDEVSIEREAKQNIMGHRHSKE